MDCVSLICIQLNICESTLLLSFFWVKSDHFENLDLDPCPALLNLVSAACTVTCNASCIMTCMHALAVL
eukprot:SAG22_NODE_218_length_14885_cov_24.733699_10_plen_69_part_00